MPKQPEVKSKTDSLNSSVITEELNDLRDIHDTIEQLISVSLQEREYVSIEIQELSNSITSFNSFKNQIDKFLAPQINLFNVHSIDIHSIFSYSIDTSLIQKLLDYKLKRLAELNLLLADTVSDVIIIEEEVLYEKSIEGISSLYIHKKEIEDKISELQAELDLPTKEYQMYLSSYNVWQQDMTNLTFELNQLDNRKAYIENVLDHALASHYKDRAILIETLFYQKYEIIRVYKELFQPVTAFKENYQQYLYSYQIDFDSNFVVNHFMDRFETYVNFGRSGSFLGKDQANKRLNELLHKYNLNEQEELASFLDELIENLHYDHKDSVKKLKPVSSQLKQNVNTEEFYEFIINLDYLEPKFQLKLAGKEITSLSPGERGALLLIFYLLLDNDKIPLIIDQPEENLDNQSIYSILVPFVQEAKERRQVILITHNPNLAVVCDADQIIHVKIDKNDRHQITCSTGSIEDVSINKLLIEVLEGTFPAFDTRNQRYTVTRSRLRFGVNTNL